MATKKKPPLTSFRCACCGRLLRQDLYVYSRFTKDRYCIDLDACKARAKKNKT